MSKLVTLSPDEQSQLSAYETTIERGLQTFYDVGMALLGIRDDRLYRVNYHSFEHYCRERWQMGRRAAYQLIDAATVIDNVRNCAQVLPANEAQARELVGLEPEQQRIVWDVVQQTAPANKVTAAHVRSVVNVLKEVIITGAIDPGEGESVRIADAFKVVITEETHERMMRQQAHILGNQADKPRKLLDMTAAVVGINPNLLTLRIDKTVHDAIVNAQAIGDVRLVLYEVK